VRDGLFLPVASENVPCADTICAFLRNVSISFSQEIIRFEVGMLWDAKAINHLQTPAIFPRVLKRPFTNCVRSPVVEFNGIPGSRQIATSAPRVNRSQVDSRLHIRSHLNQFIKRRKYFHANPCRPVSHMKFRLCRTDTSIGRRK